MVKNLPCSAGETGVGFLVLEDSTRGGATKSMVSEVHMPPLRPEAVKKKERGERERERERNPDTVFPMSPKPKKQMRTRYQVVTQTQSASNKRYLIALPTPVCCSFRFML